MPGETRNLTDFIHSPEQLRSQYQNPAKLNARAAIYRFARPGGPSWPEWVFDQLHLPAHARVLEVGCGGGGLWKQNLPRLPQGWRIFLTDLMPGMTAASRDATARDPRFRFAQADAAHLPFHSNTFDAVIANHMLYHVPDRPAALREMHRVLKVGSSLYATTNSQHHLRAIKELIYQFLASEDEQREKPDLITFTLESGTAELQPLFQSVDLRRAPGELAIPHAQPIIDYLLSIEGAPQKLIGPRMETLQRHLNAEIARNGGAFPVHTEAGMFIATRHA